MKNECYLCRCLSACANAVSGCACLLRLCLSPCLSRCLSLRACVRYARATCKPSRAARTASLVLSSPPLALPPPTPPDPVPSSPVCKGSRMGQCERHETQRGRVGMSCSSCVHAKMQAARSSNDHGDATHALEGVHTHAYIFARRYMRASWHHVCESVRACVSASVLSLPVATKHITCCPGSSTEPSPPSDILRLRHPASLFFRPSVLRASRPKQAEHVQKLSPCFDVSNAFGLINRFRGSQRVSKVSLRLTREM